jgi:hypothetical protein
MTDRFIDQDETQIYGPYASKRIRARLIGLIAAFDAGLTHLADEIDAATAAVKEAVTTARDKDAELRDGVQKKVPALAQSLDLLGRFSRHLDGHAVGVVDRKVFFTADGTVGGIGRSAPRVLLAITHITGKLDPKNKPPVSSADTWHTDFSAMMNALGPVVERADDARTDRRGVMPEVEAARQAWLQVYVAARAGVECVLRLTGKLDQLSNIFYDLTVPINTKLTSIPDDAPIQPPGDTNTP